MMIERRRIKCLEDNKFNCEDIHCMHYKTCQKDSEEAFREESERLKKKREEEERAIREIIKRNVKK